MSLERPEPDTTVVFVRFEHRDDSPGIGAPEPRLSWQVRTEDPAWRQTAYEAEPAGAATVWVESAGRRRRSWTYRHVSCPR
jgi:alpha-L-rhamnosidase